MSDLTTLFTNIADSIRTKKGTSDPIPAVNFPTEIVNLPSGGDYDSLGYEIDVEANGTISKGDKIIGQLNNAYVQPTLGETNLDDGIVSVSADFSVAIKSNDYKLAQTLTEGSQITILFRDENTGLYGDDYVITFENFPTSNFFLYNSFVINEDGTLAYSSYYKPVSSARSYETVFIALEIDKINKTAQYYYLSPSFTGFDSGNQYCSDNFDSLDLSNNNMTNSNVYTNGGIGFAYKNCIVCTSVSHQIRYSDSSIAGVPKTLTIYTYNTNTHTLSLDYHFKTGAAPFSMSSGGVYGSLAVLDENTILFTADSSTTTYYYIKYDLVNKTATISNSFSTNTYNGGMRISRNGRYISKITNSNSSATISVYSFSPIDFSVSEVYQKTIPNLSRSNNIAYVSNDGRYVYSAAGILFDMIGETSYSLSSVSVGYLINGILDTSKMITFRGSGSTPPVPVTLASLNPSSNAEYIINKYTSTDCSVVDRLYGVASENLATGQRGKARALYSTFS